VDLSYLFSPERLLTLGILFLTSMPVHEWAHAWMAYQLGDDTASLQGRLTLNPLAHLDPIGTISLFLGGFGWGKPVPVSPYRLRGNMRASHALVGAAGPFSNLVMAMLAAIPFRLGWMNPYTSNTSLVSLPNILIEFITINLSLMLFNLIPIPPLDGSRVLTWVLPARWASALEGMERQAGMGLLMIVFLLSRLGVLSLILSPFFTFMFRALFLY
jgi:Zn-dependent protease